MILLEKLAALGQKISPNLQKVIKNTAWLFADKVLRMGMALVVGVWMARYLGVQKFGLYNYALSFAGLFGMFATLGLDTIVVRDIVRQPSNKDEILGTTLGIRLMGGCLVIFLAVTSVSLVRPGEDLTRFLVAIIAAGTIFQAFDTIDLWFQSQVQSKYTVWAKTSSYLLINIGKICLLVMQAPLVVFACAWLSEFILGAVGLVFLYLSKGNAFSAWRFNLGRAKIMLLESYRLILSSIAITIYLRADAVMLGAIVGDESVGIYAVATKFSEIWYFIPCAIVASVSPSIVQAKEVSESLYQQRLQKLFNCVSGLAYAIAIPMSFIASPLIVTIFGEEYQAAGTVLSLHIWASIFVFVGVARGPWVITEGFTMSSLVTKSCGAILNVLLNLWLIPNYREMGAAIATVVSYGVSDYLLFMIWPSLRNTIGIIMTKSLTLSFLWLRK
jgi:PST family polysaccharide transporter